MTAPIRSYIDQIFTAGKNGKADLAFDNLAQTRRVCLECYDSEGVAYCESRIKALIAHVKGQGSAN